VPGLDADAVVIGAGITGAAAAHALAQDGRAVVLLERSRVGNDHGSSHGTSRIFRLSYPDKRYVRLAQSSLPGWRKLEAECGTQLLLTTGSLDLGGFADTNARALSSCGVGFETVDRAAASARWPLRFEAGERALYQPDAATILADRALRSFVEGAVAAGATLREQTEVLTIGDSRAGARVDTGADTIRCRAVIVAAGAWTPHLVQPLGIELPVVPTRETVAHFAAPRGESIPCVIDDATMADGATHGVRRAGSLTYALSSPGLGVKVGLHHSGPVADLNDRGHPDQGVVEWASGWVGRRLPEASPEPVSTETCLYTNTADESFVLSRHGRVVVASACSGHAFKFAPAIGKTLAALAAEAAAEGRRLRRPGEAGLAPTLRP